MSTRKSITGRAGKKSGKRVVRKMADGGRVREPAPALSPARGARAEPKPESGTKLPYVGFAINDTVKKIRARRKLLDDL